MTPCPFATCAATKHIDHWGNHVQYKTFGRRTGLRVSELALGTANFGTGWGHGAERDEAKRVFDGYVEANGNFIDTADRYQVGQSETLNEKARPLPPHLTPIPQHLPIFRRSRFGTAWSLQ
jgi:hypothetical protein